jgi:hypothetical protein
LEIVFSAIGINPPGLASMAPAPTTAIIGDDAILLICATAASVFWGFAGRCITRATQTSRIVAATMSKIETQVFGLEACASWPCCRAQRRLPRRSRS